jgi:hypothetical protein
MKKPVAAHPILFAAFPVLALYAHNISSVAAGQIVKPLIVALSITATFFLLLFFIFRDSRKSGLAVSFFIFWIFSYGHFYKFIFELTDYFKFGDTTAGISVQNIFFIASCLLLILSFYLILRTRKDLNDLTRILNVISVSLIVISLLNIGAFKYSHGVLWHKRGEPEKIMAKEPEIMRHPNIFYIILDAYAREDVLKEIYGYDNSDFIRFLTGKGFYVTTQSVSNYCQTVLSFASSLNFQYLDKLAAEIGADNADRKWATEMLNKSLVFKSMKSFGYATVTFDAGGSWGPVMITDVDRLYRNNEDRGISNLLEPDLNLFEKELLNNTVIHFVFNNPRKSLHITMDDEYEAHRKKMLYSFNKIEDLSKADGPIFVFAHLLTPHQPFVFDENGKATKPDSKNFTIWCWEPEFRKNFKDNYVRQLKFVNKRVKIMIERIIANSKVPPIIILQADHGPELMLDTEDPVKTNLNERMSILNAYYLPGYDGKGLYPSITPVNTFRVVFNHYFGKDYPLLKDNSFFSTWTKPYRFIDVTDMVVTRD